MSIKTQQDKNRVVVLHRGRTLHGFYPFHSQASFPWTARQKRQARTRKTRKMDRTRYVDQKRAPKGNSTDETAILVRLQSFVAKHAHQGAAACPELASLTGAALRSHFEKVVGVAP